MFLLNSCDIVYECIVLFNCPVSDAIYRREVKFITKLLHSGTIVFTDIINRELAIAWVRKLSRHYCDVKLWTVA